MLSKLELCRSLPVALADLGTCERGLRMSKLVARNQTAQVLDPVQQHNCNVIGDFA